MNLRFPFVFLICFGLAAAAWAIFPITLTQAFAVHGFFLCLWVYIFFLIDQAQEKQGSASWGIGVRSYAEIGTKRLRIDNCLYLGFESPRAHECRLSLMVKLLPSKQTSRVRFSQSAPDLSVIWCNGSTGPLEGSGPVRIRTTDQHQEIQE